MKYNTFYKIGETSNKKLSMQGFKAGQERTKGYPEAKLY